MAKLPRDTHPWPAPPPPSSFQEKWKHYRDTRKGDYAFRSATRYKAVADRLFQMGLSDEHSVLDVGAGTCQFGVYLRQRGWQGEYTPIDAVIDGTDLETCVLMHTDFAVCIEVIEHLHNPSRIVLSMRFVSRLGFVLTTPNPDAVDVIACDPTHVSEVPARSLAMWGMRVERHSWFGKPEDSLLAWRRNG